MKPLKIYLPTILLLVASHSGLAQPSILWESTGGPAVGVVVSTISAKNTDVFAGTWTSPGKVFHSANAGNIWETSFIPPSHLWLPVIACVGINVNGHVFAGITEYDDLCRMYRSTDNGATWIERTGGYLGLTTVAFDSNGTIFVAGGMFILRSADGDNWSQVYQLPSDMNRFASIAVNNAGDVFAGAVSCCGTTSGGVLRSTDNGYNWQLVNVGLSDSSVYSLAVDPENCLFAGTGSGIFRSTNNGATWTAIVQSLSISTLSTNSRGDIFAATHGSGVYRSTTHGDTWSSINAGLLDQDVYCLAASNTGVLFAGTASGTVFRTAQSTVPVAETNDVPTTSKLEQNYPNPFNPSTNIEFEIRDYGFVSLRVYDVLGREVATLVNEVKEPGSYEVMWDATGFASGVYLYRLQAGPFVDTKRLILLR